MGKIDLPPDFQAVRRPLQQRKGYGLDGPQVLGDILTHGAVAAGGTQDEYAVLIGQIHGQTVDLQLADQFKVGIVDQALGAAQPIFQVLAVEGVAQAEHRRRVGGLSETIGRGASHSLSRRVRSQTGPELMWEFGKIADQRGHKYFIYGDTDDTLQALAVKLREAFPGIRLVGQYSPPFRDLTKQEDDEVMRMINEAKPDVLWVGLGAPKQERWMYEHRERLEVPVVVGVGAAFKYHSGTINRAPRWIRILALEWLWRLGQEPGRVWRRIFVDAPQFLFLAVTELLGIRKYN